MNKPKYNPEMQLSENFRLKEFVESQTADQQGIDNRPDWEAVINLRNLCREVLQPLRDYEGKPIHVNSGYRCPELNEAVHGVGDSQHLYGEAADLHVPNIDRVSAGCTSAVAATASATATWPSLTSLPDDLQVLWTGLATDKFRAVQDRDLPEDVLAVPMGTQRQRSP